MFLFFHNSLLHSEAKIKACLLKHKSFQNNFTDYMLSKQCLWKKQEGDLHITCEDGNQKVCISFIMYNHEVVLSICRLSLLWAEWHQLHQILTHCCYERQNTQMLFLLMSSMENNLGKSALENTLRIHLRNTTVVHCYLATVCYTS